jgi:uncharacterized membrane protein YfcA
MTFETVTLILITLLAATVNGALGYGFSSITVPVALLFHTNRILNPALVLVELALNGYMLLINRNSVAAVLKRVAPIIAGLTLGVVIGSYVLSATNPGWLKFFTYATLLPLILLQAAGIRRFIRSERLIGLPFGTGIGVLYSSTTISGPPLALMFNNQGYAREEFRAGIAVIRVTEASLTAIAYLFLGLYTAESGQILWLIIPSVVIGIPLGTLIIRHVEPETFRRITINFDAWIVAFGLSRVLIELHLLAGTTAYSVLLITILIDAVLLYRRFVKPQGVMAKERESSLH